MKQFIFTDDDSYVTQKDIALISEKYLGEKIKIYDRKSKQMITTRLIRWCDLPYDKAIKATQEFVDIEMERIGKNDRFIGEKYEFVLKKIVDYWADIISDWISESECEISIYNL